MRVLYSKTEIPHVDPAEIAESVLFGDWSAEELIMVRHSVEEIFSKMEARGEKNSDDWQTVKSIAETIPGFFQPDLAE